MALRLARTPALVALRAATLLLAGAPATLAAAVGLRAEAARVPLYTTPAHPDPLDLLLLLGDLPGSLPLAALLGVAAAAAFTPVLSAAAARLYHAPTPPTTALRALREVANDLLPALLRLTLLTALPLPAIAFAAPALLGALTRYGEPAGWTGLTLEALLPAAVGLGAVLLSTAAGALALTSRVALAAPAATPTARRALLSGLRALLRRPFSALLPALAIPLLAQLTTGAWLVTWRLMDPRGAMILLMSLGFVALILIQSAAWAWLHRHLRPLTPGTSA